MLAYRAVPVRFLFSLRHAPPSQHFPSSCEDSVALHSCSQIIRPQNLQDISQRDPAWGKTSSKAMQAKHWRAPVGDVDVGRGVPVLLGQAEVDDVDLVRALAEAHQEVVRLDVAVDEALAVHILYPRDLRHGTSGWVNE